jgi:hypothetical protein
MPEESATMPSTLENDVYQYQQSMTKTDAFLRDIENKGFAFLIVNNDDEYTSFQM